MNEYQRKQLQNILVEYDESCGKTSLYYKIEDLIKDVNTPRTYIVYVDCRTFKSGIQTLEEARDWQITLGGKVYQEI